jgi:carbamoyltransferase
MNILGLHFGHDAAACVLRDGQVASYVMRERHARIKHAISLDTRTIQAAMDAARLTWDQIDHCAITSTQNIELIIDDPGFAIALRSHPRNQAPSLIPDAQAQTALRDSLGSHSLMDIFYNPAHAKSFLRHHYRNAFPEHRGREPHDFHRFGMLDIFAQSPAWQGGTLDALAQTDFSDLLGGGSLRLGFHHPVTVTIAGHELPGYLIGHHAAHAASNYYQSGFRQAAILTHDGFASGLGYLSGMYMWGEENRIHPLTPHHLAIGGLYDFVGTMLGLGHEGPAGKLMGLAAYGQPKFFDPRFVGNQYDWTTSATDFRKWFDHCTAQAAAMGYSLDGLGYPARILDPINVDIAASTQKLFEEIYLKAVQSLGTMLGRMGKVSGNLGLSGGCALNCPSNSRIFRESAFEHVYVEPGCDDSGLAIGAATWLFHNVLDNPLPAAPQDFYASPYLGLPIADDAIQTALDAVSDRVEFRACADAAQDAAQDLADGRIIGWFEGRSEIGPRALGHRSILADARERAKWEQVNLVKGREFWRPFAPAVLASEAANWFTGLPLPSPYMLFTGTATSSKVPAITHADGTARIQTVDATSGDFFRLLESFFAITGVPIVMNTSFNGPGEPIVELPADALRFLISSKLDALYIGGMRVTRKMG